MKSASFKIQWRISWSGPWGIASFSQESRIKEGKTPRPCNGISFRKNITLTTKPYLNVPTEWADVTSLVNIHETLLLNLRITRIGSSSGPMQNRNWRDQMNGWMSNSPGNWREKKKLYPVMRQAKKDKKCTKLVRGVLYLEGEMFTPSVESASQIASSRQTGPILTMRVNRLPEVIDSQTNGRVKDQLLVDRDPLENGQFSTSGL